VPFSKIAGCAKCLAIFGAVFPGKIAFLFSIRAYFKLMRAILVLLLKWSSVVFGWRRARGYFVGDMRCNHVFLDEETLRRGIFSVVYQEGPLLWTHGQGRRPLKPMKRIQRDGEDINLNDLRQGKVARNFKPGKIPFTLRKADGPVTAISLPLSTATLSSMKAITLIQQR
jgi:hypothetical protein